MTARIDTMVRLTGSLFASVIVAGQINIAVCMATEPIILEEAIALALARSPILAAQAMEAKAADARVRQVGMRPNPVIAVELEEFGGRKAMREFQSAQLTVQLAQTLELGGKRGKRKQAESLSSGLASLDYQWRCRLLVRDVTLRFAAVLAAQEHLALGMELVALQQEVEATVIKRVAAGKDPPLEETRAQVELAEVELDLRSAERELELARRGLALTWGAVEAEFEHAVTLESRIQALDDRAGLSAGLNESPLMSRWVVEEERTQAELSLAKARRIPNLTFFGGIRHLWEDEEWAYVAGLTIPFPLFDRNQGGVQETGLLASVATAERRAAQAKLRFELDEAYAGLTGAYAAITALNKDIVPAAERTFEAALAGYRNGKYEYLLVLDTLRTLFGIRARQVETRENYLEAWAQVQLLAGPSPAAPGAFE